MKATSDRLIYCRFKTIRKLLRLSFHCTNCTFRCTLCKLLKCRMCYEEEWICIRFTCICRTDLILSGTEFPDGCVMLTGFYGLKKGCPYIQWQPWLYPWCDCVIVIFYTFWLRNIGSKDAPDLWWSGALKTLTASSADFRTAVRFHRLKIYVDIHHIMHNKYFFWTDSENRSKTYLFCICLQKITFLSPDKRT